MKQPSFSFFIFVIIECYCEPVLIRKSNDPFIAAKSELPESEQVPFLMYHLSAAVADIGEEAATREGASFLRPDELGINEDLLKKFKAINIPSTSNKQLYWWTRNAFKLSHREVEKLVRDKLLCNDNGDVCLSLPGINEVCCPW